MSSIRVAVIGAGVIAPYHVEALRTLDDEVEVVGAVETDSARLAEFCSRYAIAGRYPDVNTMLRDARPDLVHVCTPPNLHVEQALACLGANVSVVVEKPPTLSLREMDILIAAEGTEESSGPWVATVFQHRFGSGMSRLRAAMADGALGRPLVAVCNTMWFRDQAYFDVPGRGRWDIEGGGPVISQGIHQMDLLTAVLGDWVEVTAHAHQQARRMAVEDLSVAHVGFANGAVASVVNSLLSPREESYLRFDFEHATVEVGHLYGYGDDDWRITPAPGFEDQVLAAWKAGEWGLASGHPAQIAAVVESLRAGTAPPVSSTEARRTMQLVAGIYASAFGGRPIGPKNLASGSPFYARMEGDGPHW